MLLKKKQGSFCVIFYLVNGGSHMWSVYGLFQICAPESLQVRNCEVPGMKPASSTCRACTQPFALSLQHKVCISNCAGSPPLAISIFSPSQSAQTIWEANPKFCTFSFPGTPSFWPIESVGGWSWNCREKKEEVKLISPHKVSWFGAQFWTWCDIQVSGSHPCKQSLRQTLGFWKV